MKGPDQFVTVSSEYKAIDRAWCFTLTALKYVCINHGHQRVFYLEVMINVLVSSFRFIWVPLLWYTATVYFLIIPVREPTLDVRIWLLCVKRAVQYQTISAPTGLGAERTRRKRNGCPISQNTPSPILPTGTIRDHNIRTLVCSSMREVLSLEASLTWQAI